MLYEEAARKWRILLSTFSSDLDLENRGVCGLAGWSTILMGDLCWSSIAELVVKLTRILFWRYLHQCIRFIEWSLRDMPRFASPNNGTQVQSLFCTLGTSSHIRRVELVGKSSSDEDSWLAMIQLEMQSHQMHSLVHTASTKQPS